MSNIMKIESILCPIDPSTNSDEALVYAIALSTAYNAALILLHCNTAEPSNDPTAHEKTATAIRQALVRYCDDAALLGISWRSVVVTGDDVGATIAREAAILRVDLIVMRSRRRPYRAALLGSTAEFVSRNAPCPVMVMHSDEREWVTGAKAEIDLKRVLVAYDFSDYSELALNYGLSLAQEYQAELHLLHVLLPANRSESEISWYPLGRESAYHQAARRLQRAVPSDAHLWCDVRNAVTEGQPYREILSYAAQNEIDLICLGAHGAGFGMHTLFGSNVDRVLRQAPCPVLVSQPLRPAMGSGEGRGKIVEPEIGHCELTDLVLY
jgi:nucleotide-binding universal stress UspA family protein